MVRKKTGAGRGKARSSKPKVPTAPRACLKCDEPFLSTGPTNRLCGRCNSQNTGLSRIDIQGGRKTGGRGDDHSSPFD